MPAMNRLTALAVVAAVVVFAGGIGVGSVVQHRKEAKVHDLEMLAGQASLAALCQAALSTAEASRPDKAQRILEYRLQTAIDEAYRLIPTGVIDPVADLPEGSRGLGNTRCQGNAKRP
jgi:hypothetical protein